MSFSDFRICLHALADTPRTLPRRDGSGRALGRSGGPDRAALPQAGGGKKLYPLGTVLRIHLLQNWLSLSDPTMEEALYEITPMHQFARLTLSAAPP